MIEIEMSSDIRDFSPKIVSIFDKRQLVCLLISIAIGLPTTIFLPISDITTKLTIVTIVVAPVMICGWVKLYGMPPETFLIKYMLPMMFNPTKRIYATKNTYNELFSYDEPTKLLREIPPQKISKKNKKEINKLLKMYNANV